LSLRDIYLGRVGVCYEGVKEFSISLEDPEVLSVVAIFAVGLDFLCLVRCCDPFFFHQVSGIDLPFPSRLKTFVDCVSVRHMTVRTRYCDLWFSRQLGNALITTGVLETGNHEPTLSRVPLSVRSPLSN